MVSFGIIYFFFSRLNIDLGVAWDIMRKANLLLYLGAFGMFYLDILLRGFRWSLLLKNVGFGENQGNPLPSSLGLSRVIVMSWFANSILPAKLGDAYRAYLVKRWSGVSFTKTIGTIFAERIIDVCIIFLLLIVAALGVLQAKNAAVSLQIIQMGSIMVLIITAGLIGMRFLGPIYQRVLPSKWQRFYRLFHEGTLHSFRQLPLLIALSIIIWVSEAARFTVLATSLGMSVSIPMLVFVSLSSALLIGLPFTPGGLGVVEAGVVGLLMTVVSKESAVSMVLLDRTITYWHLLVLGFMVHLWGLRGENRRRLYPRR